MSERKRRVEDLLEGMGRMVVPVPDESAEEREQVIEAVNRRLDAAHFALRRRTDKRWLILVAAAVLCLSSGFAFARYGYLVRSSHEIAPPIASAPAPARSPAETSGAARAPMSAVAAPSAPPIAVEPPAPVPAIETSVGKPLVPRKSSSAGASANIAEPPSSSPEASTLAQENDLYAAASSSARSGNDAQAVTELNALLARYPSSPLAQNARVDRFRALNRLGRSHEAVAQARRYLADYPNGFARDEAKALVLRSLANP